MNVKSVIFFVSSVLLFVSGCFTNPITGKDELMFVTEEQDIELGKAYAPELEEQLGGKIPDLELQNYVDRVGQKVAGVSHWPELEYHFIALDDEMMNAFALPGGYIFITRGMLEKLESESQLAAILAHETAHVVARDTSAAISRDIGINLALSAVFSENTAQSALLITDITNQIIGLSYSREDEKTADLGGLDYMFAAGYNPYGMVEAMQKINEESESRPIEFLSTHPNPENRIEYLLETIGTGYYEPEKLKSGKDEYQRLVLDKLEELGDSLN